MGLKMKACRPLRCRSVEKRGGWVTEEFHQSSLCHFWYFFSLLPTTKRSPGSLKELMDLFSIPNSKQGIILSPW